ncbi:MAG: hypothetical protein WBZ25_09945, partial [Pseudolabrys sp.]
MSALAGVRPCFETLLYSLVTLLPDYLYRRYVQGKRLGKEITFYSVWFELRWSTSNVTIFFRTVSILPETT